MGAGETGQAVSLANYFVQNGEKVVFCLVQKVNLPFLRGKPFSVYHTPFPEDLKKIIISENPEAVLYFNSKIWKNNGKFQTKRISSSCRHVTVDSNWLFNEKGYPDFRYISWADRYFVNMPKSVFLLGLRRNGGGFSVPDNTLERIEATGMIPFYKKISQKKKKDIRKKLNVKEDEKLIFSYFGGFGAGHRVWAFQKLISSLKEIQKRTKIKLVYSGLKENLNDKYFLNDWIIHKENMPSEEFFETLSSSDLVFQHQGLATLAQAICANIPVIANVGTIPGWSIPRIHIYEVEPFQKEGLCLMQKKSDLVTQSIKNISMLLFNQREREKMISCQKKHSQRGELYIYKKLKKIVEN